MYARTHARMVAVLGATLLEEDFPSAGDAPMYLKGRAPVLYFVPKLICSNNII